MTNTIPDARRPDVARAELVTLALRCAADDRDTARGPNAKCLDDLLDQAAQRLVAALAPASTDWQPDTWWRTGFVDGSGELFAWVEHYNEDQVRAIFAAEARASAFGVKWVLQRSWRRPSEQQWRDVDTSESVRK